MSYRLLISIRKRCFHNGAITANEFSQAMNTLKITSNQTLGLAVSGGADSMALLRLTVEWRRARSRAPLFVFSVNHDVRPEAADEVAWVSEQCRLIGIESQIPIHSIPLKIVWPEGPLPYSKLQAEARHARYELLGRACDQYGIDRLLVGHHLNDQAETFLLRLARASGIEGLGCMHAGSQTRSGPVIIRPLLSFPKQRLVASCRERFRQNWREDPSNQNLVFDRVRIRSVVNRMPAELLNRLHGTISHLQRLHMCTQQFYSDIMLEVCTWVHPLSACWVSIPKLRRHHRSVVRAVLTKIFQIVSSETKIKLKSLNNFLDYIYEDTEVVLGFRDMFSCRIRRFPQAILIMPDYSRRSTAVSPSSARSIRCGTAEFTAWSGPLPAKVSSVPISDVWKQLQTDFKTRNYVERLPNTAPVFIREAELFALMCSKTNRIVAAPALAAMSLDVTFTSKLVFD